MTTATSTAEMVAAARVRVARAMVFRVGAGSLRGPAPAAAGARPERRAARAWIRPDASQLESLPVPRSERSPELLRLRALKTPLVLRSPADQIPVVQIAADPRSLRPRRTDFGA